MEKYLAGWNANSEEVVPTKSINGQNVKLPLLGKDVVKHLQTTPQEDKDAAGYANKFSGLSKWKKYSVWKNQCVDFANQLYEGIEDELIHGH